MPRLSSRFDAHSALLQTSPSEVTPWLLELVRGQAARRRPADLISQLERDRFVHPSFLDQRLIHQLDGMLAPSGQDRTLTTTRGSEVVSDPTNVLALLCAQRLRRELATPVRLCSVHQVLRAQPLPPQPGFSRHYRLFVLGEAGFPEAEERFELNAVRRHLTTFAQLLVSAEQVLGCRFPNRRLVVQTSSQRQALCERITDLLRQHFRQFGVETQTLESNYYDGMRILLGADTSAGEFCQLGDLGLFDWVGKLLSNRRIRFVASGFGIQLLPALFKP